MFKPVTIRDGHDNFFTPLRLFFALMVLVGHAVVIVKGGSAHETKVFFNYTPSYLAVNLFFIASGFLVTKSMLYRGDLAAFASARILRIFPALAAHVLFIMFVMGPFVTTLPLREFFTDPQFFMQPFMVLSFFQTNMVLPGALTTNAEPFASAALWTLRYEFLAYIATALIFSLGFMRKKWMILLQFVVCACAWPLSHITGLHEHIPPTLQSMLRFGIAYSLGAVIFAYRDRLKFHAICIPLIAIAAALFHDRTIFEVLVNVLMAYFIFWAAYVKIPKANSLHSMTDISYGVYIYHWGVMQWLFYAFPSMGIGDLVMCGAMVTIPISILSWHLIEKPALSMKKSFAERLRFGRDKPQFNRASVLAD